MDTSILFTKLMEASHFIDEALTDIEELNRNRERFTDKAISDMETDILKKVQFCISEHDVLSAEIDPNEYSKKYTADQEKRWQELYSKGWATKEHLERLANINILTAQDYTEITGEEIPRDHIIV